MAGSRTEKYLNGLRGTSWLGIGFVMLFDLLSLFLLFTETLPLVIVILPWIFVIGIGIFLLGKLRFSDLGIVPAKIIPALLFGLGYWLILQLVFATTMFLLDGQVSCGTVMPGYLVDQLLFFALAEEIIFRGFLFPQVFLKLKRDGQNQKGAFWGALLVSQVFFSLTHIPHRLINSTPTQDIPFHLLLLLVSGLYLCYVYLRSQNLFVAVIVHALGNFPTTVISHNSLPWYVINLIMMGTAIFVIEIWQRISASKEEGG